MGNKQPKYRVRDNQTGEYDYDYEENQSKNKKLRKTRKEGREAKAYHYQEK